MIALASSKVRSHFKEICDKVVDNFEAVIITRTRGENVVMISEEQYNNIMENFRIFSNTELHTKVKTGIDQLESGKSQARKLIDE